MGVSKVEHDWGCIEIDFCYTLSKGSEFDFRARALVNGGRWLLSFSINSEYDETSCGLLPGERAEVIKLLLDIWKRFEVYPCGCTPYGSHQVRMFKKLGFGQSEDYERDDYLVWNPS